MGRRPSRVIYVVNRCRPSQTKGDWAVRGHGKVYSYHRLKSAAIKKARQIAKKKGYTVLIQGKDGKFVRGFTPIK